MLFEYSLFYLLRLSVCIIALIFNPYKYHSGELPLVDNKAAFTQNESVHKSMVFYILLKKPLWFYSQRCL